MAWMSAWFFVEHAVELPGEIRQFGLVDAVGDAGGQVTRVKDGAGRGHDCAHVAWWRDAQKTRRQANPAAAWASSQ